MGQPAARVTDMHTCPLLTVLVPHVGGPILPLGGFPTLIGKMPAARMGDMAFCVGPPDAIIKGSFTVLIGKKPAARMGDMTVHGGVIVGGFPTVLIGDAGSSIGGAPVVINPDGSISVGDFIRIVGDADFQARVLADLAVLATTPTGEDLFNSLDASGRTVTIQEQTDIAAGNATGYANGGDRFFGVDGNPGPGTDSTIFFDPNRTQVGDGSEDWMTRPSYIGLGHELSHSEQAANGVQEPGSTGGTRNRELQATGLPPHDGNDVNENNFREDLGEPPRTHY